MMSINMNSTKAMRTHRLMGRLSAFCWWASILMMLVHLGFCFTDRTWLETSLFAKSLVKDETIILAVISARWIIQAALYFLFGRAILKNNMKQMVVLAIISLVLPIGIQLLFG